MNDGELKRLASLTPGLPTDDARERALQAAMVAYDTQLNPEQQKNATTTQGTATSVRPTSTIKHLWSLTMNSLPQPNWNFKTATLAMATGVVALPFAAVVAWNVAEEQLLVEVPVVLDGKAQLKQAEPEVMVLQESMPALDQVNPEGLESPSQVAAAPVRRLAKGLPSGNPSSAQSFSQPLGIVSGQNALVARPQIQPTPVPSGGEIHTKFEDNHVVSTAADPVSTFSIDVDTASYARVRASLNAGNLPLKDMVRVEEMVNYFDYSYPLPKDRAQPFKPTVMLTQTPWNKHTQLLQIGIKGYDLSDDLVANSPGTNLVLLLDVSGSMADADKLPLLVKSFKLLLRKLKPTDTVSIVTYAGRSATLLDSVKASDRSTILHALENLRAGGSTAGAGGIQQAYRLAEKNFIEGGVNRVMLATDGDFNVGISDPDQLKDMISSKRKTGVYLSVFGFGQGNYNDALMQSLAQNGNGQAAYIDTLSEARKALVEEAGGTMFTIASDVKIQLEFNPAKVAEYRLIGYETRALNREDFNNDKVDAGEIGAGHTVTALYELTPVGSPAVLNSPLRYDENATRPLDPKNDELGYLKLRYKQPGDSQSQLLQQPIKMTPPSQQDSALKIDAQFAAAVAAFGQKLRGQPAVSDYSYQQIAELARSNRGDDPNGYRAAFVQLVQMADALAE